MSWAIRLGNTGIIPPLILGTAQRLEGKIYWNMWKGAPFASGRADTISDWREDYRPIWLS
jgi:hypothetical protein